MTNLNDLGKEFDAPPFNQSDCESNPIMQFEKWFLDAQLHEKEANGMNLATVDSNGQPNCRVVLLKYFDRNGLVFFTNYESCKGNELRNNPNAAVNFWWQSTQRQVRILGQVTMLDRSHSQVYFGSRPRDSQIAATVSKQSQIIDSPKTLKKQFDNYKSQTSGEKQLKCPEYWGGYIFKPHYFEFWQGRPCRLHDRITYKLLDQQWQLQRLCP